MPKEASKNAADVINGMFREMTGLKMRTLSKLIEKRQIFVAGDQKRTFQKPSKFTPSMVFIGVSLNF